MPKYWGKQISSLRSFPEVGQKQKTEKKKERLKVGNIQWPAHIANATSGGARKAAWAICGYWSHTKYLQITSRQPGM